MSVRVLKFGGTLLTTSEQRAEVARIVEQTREQAGAAPVVVVSAMGREGDSYATDTLLRLLHEAGDDPDPVTVDLMLSCGEAMSAALVAHTLTARGWPAVPFTAYTAGVESTAEPSNAAPLRVDVGRIRAALAGGLVPVVTGFQGVDDERRVTTFGRGGSDLTALLMGAALAAPVDIVKDVDAVMTADPRLVPDTRPVRRMSYAALCTLLSLGSRVVQLRAARFGWRRRVPLAVRGTTAMEGTTVEVSDVVDLRDEGGDPTFAIACCPGLSLLRVADRTGERDRLRLLQELTTGVDHAFVDSNRIALWTSSEEAPRLRLSLREQGAGTDEHSPCSRVSVVAAVEERWPAWLAHGMSALARASVPVLGSYGSESAISYLVPEGRQGDAARALHAAFEDAGRPRALAG